MQWLLSDWHLWGRHPSALLSDDTLQRCWEQSAVSSNTLPTADIPDSPRNMHLGEEPQWRGLLLSVPHSGTRCYGAFCSKSGMKSTKEIKVKNQNNTKRAQPPPKYHPNPFAVQGNKCNVLPSPLAPYQQSSLLAHCFLGMMNTVSGYSLKDWLQRTWQSL